MKKAATAANYIYFPVWPFEWPFCLKAGAELKLFS